jgi:hypothetical protein
MYTYIYDDDKKDNLLIDDVNNDMDEESDSDEV